MKMEVGWDGAENKAGATYNFLTINREVRRNLYVGSNKCQENKGQTTC